MTCLLDTVVDSGRYVTLWCFIYCRKLRRIWRSIMLLSVWKIKCVNQRHPRWFSYVCCLFCLQRRWRGVVWRCMLVWQWLAVLILYVNVTVTQYTLHDVFTVCFMAGQTSLTRSPARCVERPAFWWWYELITEQRVLLCDVWWPLRIFHSWWKHELTTVKMCVFLWVCTSITRTLNWMDVLSSLTL